ncbi:MAG: arsenate reductase family protein [Methylotenera sp.]|nr:arsenate reductase family protein [Oligoflexia bacterium]
MTKSGKPAVRIYEYANCSTCKTALKFLERHQIAHVKLPIVDEPPSKSELKKMLSFYQGDLKKLFNTSGQVYREMGLGAKLSTLTQDEALELLAKNGKLIKRPFLLSSEGGLVGFREAEWQKLLG